MLQAKQARARFRKSEKKDVTRDQHHRDNQIKKNHHGSTQDCYEKGSETLIEECESLHYHRS